MDKLLAERLERHSAEISRRFFHSAAPVEITACAQTGDRHLHGETVLKLETSAGNLYYKPRDGAGTELLGQLNELLFGERLVPEQITGREYAFQKEVVCKLPSEGEERAAFYHWFGRLTAVFYALGSTDMHCMNVIPSGSRPCAVDTETLLSAKAEDFGGSGDFPLSYGDVFPEYRMSVGECMVLPRFYALIQKSPLIPGDGCTPRGYEGDFINGFQAGYRTILDHRKAVYPLLERYRHYAVRYILRSTGAYNSILAQYAFCRTDVERGLVLGRLSKGLGSEERRRWQPILDWETSCLKEGDVPYFWIRADERALRGDREGARLMEDFFSVSPLEHAKERIRSMDERDLSVQCDYIRASLRHIDGWTNPTARFLRSPAVEPEVPSEPLSRQTAVNEAAHALHELRAERIMLSHGRCLWHIPLTGGKAGSLYGLAQGFSGVGVFCRAASRSPLLSQADAELAHELADACLRDMLLFASYLLSEYPDAPEERLITRRFDGGFGFENGLSGFLWALKICRDPGDRESGMLLEAFKRWNIDDGAEKMPDPVLGTAVSSRPDTDILSGGLAGRAACLLNSYRQADTAAWDRAGRLLAWMYEQKEKNGSYRIFQAGRKQYFLPAFLRGSLGIAAVMLRYAELSDS